MIHFVHTLMPTYLSVCLCAARYLPRLGWVYRLVMGLAVRKRAQRSEYLMGVQLLSTLTQSERETVIDNMAEESYEEGIAVITQGDVGSKFFIVTEGELVVTQVRVLVHYCPATLGRLLSHVLTLPGQNTERQRRSTSICDC